MSVILEFLVILLYSLALLMLFLFSLGQLHLTWHYLKNKKKNKSEKAGRLISFPKVTVQLPVYNEKYVAERLINRIVELRYPKELLQIHVLDDSTDETRLIINELVERYRASGFQIEHLTREHRTGFKAGALQNGLEKSSGEFIAIFDSDFLPPEDFLIKSIPYFNDESVGMVQTRWGHVNEDFSLLTRIQAFGLNAHFTVEQTGRKAAGSFINFNGTAGIWRKKCIEDAGGWSADTLTEDLDLSYRAQLRNWKFEFLEDVVSPAELPILVSAIKTQQFRWNKGAAETGRKLIKRVLQSQGKKINKIHAIMHLFNSAVFIFLFIAGILSVPALWLKQNNEAYQFLFNLGLIFLVGFFSIIVFYWISYKNIKTADRKNFFGLFASFLIVIMGLSYHNCRAVIEGLLGFRTPFHRTPKFNVLRKGDRWSFNSYSIKKLGDIGWMEGFLFLYFLAGISLGVYLKDAGLMLFHFMLSAGFFSIFFYSLKQHFTR